MVRIVTGEVWCDHGAERYAERAHYPIIIKLDPRVLSGAGNDDPLQVLAVLL